MNKDFCKIIKINIQPFPAVRVNGRFGRFSTNAKRYHEKMNLLREEVGDKKNEIIKSLLDGNYEIIFQMKIPKSWSKKKKAEMLGKPHRQTPDIDNLFKALTDSIFYKEKENDSGIHTMNAKKIWGDEDFICFNDTTGKKDIAKKLNY